MSTSTPTATVRTRVRIPLRFADGYSVSAEVVTFHGLVDGAEHIALVLGDTATGTSLVRMHSECLTGDVFGSARCDCGPQLREAVQRIDEVGGVVLYLRQEGRGIGLYNKLDAYALQDTGLDTYQANLALGLPEDGRDYTAAAQMLAALGITELNLLTNNPDKAGQLRELGVTVTETVPTSVHATPDNLRYLHAKAEHTQHTITLPGLTSLVG
ncbi:GTP cyclohydrolase II [Lentzea nigeriaca]|uniref:GTP cyclohydrolase II n=1 Tax=Lentzea nigeriaca TaxID=1128665 RepID=UPI00195658F2|nr:GTP cyclohydrolase II [Lentzea nigeriaca]MBM7857455.1 GTP cyclohydrolase II [Lentzea nigeriaca]